MWQPPRLLGLLLCLSELLVAASSSLRTLDKPFRTSSGREHEGFGLNPLSGLRSTHVCLRASFRKRALLKMANFWRRISLGLFFSPRAVILGWLAFHAYSLMLLAQGDRRESGLSRQNVGSVLPIPYRTKSIKDTYRPPWRDYPAIVWRNGYLPSYLFLHCSILLGYSPHVCDDGGQLSGEPRY
ncbi:Hypothetical predicted protein [Olea europaea subsp. europaea]|uniref:Uncharacterized protein n=1 Tax=Olea europaea subsp. europaea TaxID=158383 RepID=A0A8S0UIY9_OLEEU|nr:Hypothetical predicted protein [Olea europaea subsp. europaea]